MVRVVRIVRDVRVVHVVHVWRRAGPAGHLETQMANKQVTAGQRDDSSRTATGRTRDTWIFPYLDATGLQPKCQHVSRGQVR